MANEIERKFLVTDQSWRKGAGRGKSIIQAYLTLTGKASVRVRITGNEKAFLTIKSSQSGVSRSEFEYPISVKDARELMRLRSGLVIEKRRYVVNVGKDRFEVDVFNGKQSGLVLAEIELKGERARFHRPTWLGKEVTGKKRYYNAKMASA